MNRRPPRRPQAAPQAPHGPQRPGHYWNRHYWYHPYHYWYWDYPDYDYYDYDDTDLYDYYYDFGRYDTAKDDFARGFRAGMKQAQREMENKEGWGYTGSQSAAGYCGSAGA